jgi:hypothetical protein
VRSASIAKIIMIAFFLTMPISRITPMNAMIENSVPKSFSASSARRPRTAASKDRDRMHEAFVQHAEHDVHVSSAARSARRLAVDAWKARALPWNVPRIVSGTPIRASSSLTTRWPATARHPAA